MLADSFHVVGLYCMKNLSYSEAGKALSSAAHKGKTSDLCGFHCGRKH